MSELDLPSRETVAGLDVPKSLTLRNFWQSVATGRWHQASEREIEEVVDDQMFSHKPLTELTKKEEQFLKKRFVKALYANTQEINYEELATGPVVYIPKATEGEKDAYPDLRYHKIDDLFVVGEVAQDLIKNGAKSLTKEQKVKMFSDPKVWTFTHTAGTWYSSPAIRQGTRFFFRDKKLSEGYYGLYTIEKFEKLMERVKKTTGKRNLNILDIGGSNGLALAQLKKMYPDLETFNLTVDEEPGTWPVDHFIFSPAERIDMKYKESFDIVVSSVAWRYFVYPDVALRNAVKSLSVGGEMAVQFGWDRCPLDIKEIEERLEKLWLNLRVLNKKGILKVNESGVQMTDYNNKIPYNGVLFIRKIKSLPEESL